MWIQRTEGRKPRLMERYTDQLTGKQKILSVTIQNDTTRGRKKAEAELAEKLNRINTPVQKVAGITLQDVCEEYLRYLRSRNRKQSTILRCETQFRQFQNVFGSDTLADQINARTINHALDPLDKSNAWKNEAHKRLKALFRFAHRRDLVEDVRWIDKLEPYPEQTKREKVADKFLERDELRAVLDAMPLEYWKNMTAFLALSGLRIGEAIALNMDDVDMESRLIHVTKTYSTNSKQTTAPKTFDSFRDVYMQDQLYKLCHQMRSESLRLAVLFGFRDKAFIRQGDGKRAQYDSFRQYFGDTCEKVLDRRCTPHILRHTMTSLFAEQGIPLEVIQHRLGHSDSDTTREIYLHITEKRKQMEHELIKNIAII